MQLFKFTLKPKTFNQKWSFYLSNLSCKYRQETDLMVVSLLWLWSEQPCNSVHCLFIILLLLLIAYTN